MSQPTDNRPLTAHTLLFVYGTLKRGGCRALALDGQRFLGTARTRPKYRMYNCGLYPGLVEEAGGQSIEGELWAVDAACLARLDEIEASPDLFCRGRVELESPHEALAVESYFYQPGIRGLPDAGTCWKLA